MKTRTSAATRTRQVRHRDHVRSAEDTQAASHAQMLQYSATACVRNSANNYAGLRVFAPAAACSANGTHTAVDSKYDMPNIANTTNR